MPSPHGSPRRRDDLLLAGTILLGAVALWTAFLLYTGICLEDALITYRYARNLARGDGFVFNLSEQVLATTTPLLTLILGLLGAVFGEQRIPLICNILMMAASAGAGLLTWDALRRLGYGRPPSIFIMAAYWFHPEIVWTTCGGMETPLVLLFMAVGLHAVSREAYGFAAGAAALLALTRIDGGVWAVGIYLIILWRGRSAFIRSLLIGALITVPWILFASVYFGSPIPHSIVAKRAIGSSGDIFSLAHFQEFITWCVPFFASSSLMGVPAGIIFFAIGAASLRRRGAPPALWLLALFPVVLSSALYLGRSPLYFDWYLTPVVYSCLIVGGLGIWILGGFVCGKLPAKWPASLAAVLFCLAHFSLSLHHCRQAAEFHRDYQINEEATRRAIGEWLGHETPPDSTVAMEAVGYQGYYSDRRIIDLAGLTSPAVVELRRASPSNAEAFYRVLSRLRPDYLVLRSFEVDRNAHYHGGRLFETNEHLAYFAAHYEEVRRFEAPLPRAWGLTSYLTIYRRRVG